MIELRIEGGIEASRALSQIKLLAADHPGDHELELRVMRGGELRQTLRLGPLWGYSGDAGCLAALGEFGDAVLAPVR